jgi:membrane-associated phospholipid phosphatase
VAGNWDPLDDRDESLAAALHSFAIGHRTWVVAMDWWCRVFDPNSLRVAAAVLVVWLWWRKHAPRLAWWVAITMTAGGVIGAVLKLLVGRHRPDLLEPVARAAGYSFPSGHALNNALAAGVFLLVFLPFTRGRPVRRALLWAVVILVPLITGICRVALGVHWTSDVVGGWLIGVAVVAATATAFEAWRVRSGHRRTDVAEEGVEPEITRDDSRSEHA